MSLRILNALTLLLVIVGGVNWGLVGLFRFDMVTEIFSVGTGEASTVARIVYVLIGLSALWQLALLFRRLTPKD